MLLDEKEKLAERICLYLPKKKQEETRKAVKNGEVSMEGLQKIYDRILDEFEEEVLRERAKENEKRRKMREEKKKLRGKRAEGMWSNGWYIKKDLGKGWYIMICPSCKQEIKRTWTSHLSKMCRKCYLKKEKKHERVKVKIGEVYKNGWIIKGKTGNRWFKAQCPKCKKVVDVFISKLNASKDCGCEKRRKDEKKQKRYG